jgi:hypothetical protein
MMALTVIQPWAWAICYLGKPVENRDWRPSDWYLRVGAKFAIHAGKMPSATRIREAFGGMLQAGVVKVDQVPSYEKLAAQEGAIVAVAHYGGAVREHPSRWFAGRFGWKLLGEREDTPMIVLPRPVPCMGHQKLWTVPGDVLEAMRAQFRSPSLQVEPKQPKLPSSKVGWT